MAAAGEQPQAFFRFGGSAGFRQDTGAGGNHGVGGDDVGVALQGGEFSGGQTQCVVAREFVGEGGFVDIGGKNLVRLDADLPEQSQAARAGGG